MEEEWSVRMKDKESEKVELYLGFVALQEKFTTTELTPEDSFLRSPAPTRLHSVTICCG